MRSTPRSFAVVALVAALLGGCDSPVAPEFDIEFDTGPVVLTALGQTVRLTPRVVNLDGQPRSGVRLTWMTGDSTVASVSADGTVTAVGPGSTIVSARSGSVSGHVDVSVAQKPTSLAIESGDQQRGLLGTSLLEPVAVVVRDSLGSVIPGVLIRWRLENGGRAEPVPNSATDEDGIGRARWTLRNVPGTDSLVASVGDVPAVTFHAAVLPIIDAIDSLPFFAGQSLTLRGRGLAGATVEIAGRPATVVSSSFDVARFTAPDSLAPCTGTALDVSLVVRVRDVSVERSVATLGSPVAGPTTSGSHLVSPFAGSSGCPIRVPSGSYAVAVYTMAPVPNPVDMQYENTARTYTLSVRPLGPAPRVVQVQAGASTAGAALRADVTAASEPRAPAATTSAAPVCQREPLHAGQVVYVRDFVDYANGTWGNVGFRVAKVTPHIQMLVPAAVYDTMKAVNTARIATLADSAEVKAYPFLRDLFGTLPDYDGSGHLTVLMNNGNFYGGWNRFVDDQGCTAGNFVNLASPEDWGLTTSSTWSPGAPFGALQTLVHEATHWVERDDSRTPAYWGVEGLANLTAFLWWYRQLGRDLWTGKLPRTSLSPPPSSVGAAHTCFLESGYYGAHRANEQWWAMGYSMGCALLRYLVDQRRMEGADPVQLMRRLTTAGSSGDVRPIWEQLGGAGRTEAELQGEFLLMHYASDYVSGISPRLINSSFDLRAPGAEPTRYFPLPFPISVVRADRATDVELELKQPDGFVLELTNAQEGTLIRIEPGSGLSLAILKK